MALKFQIVDTKTNEVLATEFLVARGEGHAFSTGSFGYNASGKISLPSVNDGEIIERHQVSVNLIQIKSK